MTQVDRRKAVRIPAKLAMEIRISDVDKARVESINVSANGVYFTSGASRVPPAGPIIDRDGQVLGEHQGLANFTIGQRKGIGISAHSPLYVLQKDMSRNALIVGPAEALGRSAVAAMASISSVLFTLIPLCRESVNSGSRNLRYGPKARKEFHS